MRTVNRRAVRSERNSSGITWNKGDDSTHRITITLAGTLSLVLQTVAPELSIQGVSDAVKQNLAHGREFVCQIKNWYSCVLLIYKTLVSSPHISAFVRVIQDSQTG